MCVVEKHAEHDVADVDGLYEQHMDVIRNLQKVIEAKVGRQSNVKAKVDALRSQILQSYQQVCITSHIVINVFCIKNNIYIYIYIILY